MRTKKTAISVQESLLEQVDLLALRMQLPRSQVFSLAAKEFIDRHENRRLLEEINAAYADIFDEEEGAMLGRMRRHHRRTVEGQW